MLSVRPQRRIAGEALPQKFLRIPSGLLLGSGLQLHQPLTVSLRLKPGHIFLLKCFQCLPIKWLQQIHFLVVHIDGSIHRNFIKINIHIPLHTEIGSFHIFRVAASPASHLRPCPRIVKCGQIIVQEKGDIDPLHPLQRGR